MSIEKLKTLEDIIWSPHFVHGMKSGEEAISAEICQVQLDIIRDGIKEIKFHREEIKDRIKELQDIDLSNKDDCMEMLTTLDTIKDNIQKIWYIMWKNDITEKNIRKLKEVKK